MIQHYHHPPPHRMLQSRIYAYQDLGVGGSNGIWSQEVRVLEEEVATGE
jgi:hypothetical protein